jgi:pilus assembly protein CpaB
MDHRREWLNRLLTGLAWRRRLLAGGLAAAGAALAIEAASPAPPPTAEVIVAARPLPGGHTLTADDVRTAAYHPDTVPAGALGPDDVLGRVLAGPLDDGEPLTATRVIGPGLLDGWDRSLVAVPVRIADAGSVGLLRPGDVIDLVATSMDGMGETGVVAAGVPVLTIRPDDETLTADGALVVVAGTREQATTLAGAAVNARLSFTVGSPHDG